MEIKNIESITPKCFNALLKEKWRDSNVGRESGAETVEVPEILSVSTQRVEQGVLSQVYRIHLEYKDDSFTGKTCPPSDWLIKLCRTDLNLSWMCQNEATFYRTIVPYLYNDGNALPFSIPAFLSGDDQHIILQQILSVETFPLTEGCPPDKIPLLLKCLAALHSKCWEDSSKLEQLAKDSLIVPAGMGQRLHPLQKEGLFVKAWQDTIDHLEFHPEQDAETLQFITKFCQKLETIKIRDLHDAVHRHRVTLIHGDFHISNFLFPVQKGTSDDLRPYLVDWATSGFANPMIDLVFFLVVSTNDQVASDAEILVKEYHRLLLLFEPGLKDRVSHDTLKEWFRYALICQWTILVAYDEMCRHIANSEQDERRRETQLRHFKNVNRRAILALKNVQDWDIVWEKIQSASEAEKMEARLFCETNTIEI
ncbi:ecdysteroid kinase [Nitzschia inconspicua]|uniref:Ecdysteroid kinase n=1 Tax=Nitzschia inconspicua TaxID=303405 RepID=A0A9K3LS96_9STRA|nr:ecdysteroid kinase [Nitzschia inconspicua]